MNITEIRVKLISDNAERLRAFCSLTLDGDFVIRDLKVIEGTNGPFVAMPSRKLADRCENCGCKNHLRARHCNECGTRLNEGRAPRDGDGRVKLHADVAHPINTACRERLQEAVIVAYKEELGRSEEPDYTPPPLSEEDDSGTSEYQELVADLRESAEGRGRRSRATAPVASELREDSRQEASHSTNEPTTSAPDADDAACPAPESSEAKSEDDAFGDGIL